MAATAVYARIVRNRERAGVPTNGFDAQIASICRTHQAIRASEKGVQVNKKETVLGVISNSKRVGSPLPY